ncbi:MAG: YceI family protein, partial [Gemmatimonadales bacterium]
MNRRTLVLVGMLLAGLADSLTAQESGPPLGGRWVVDIVHSQIDFRVRHLVGRVRGTFTNWYAVIITDNRGFRNGRVNVTVQTASLNTGNAMRDADLRTERFFAVDSFPELTFRGTGMAVSDTTTEVVGILSIKGHTHPATFKGQFRGVAKDSEGHERIAFDATTTIDRRNYGMEWNSVVGANTLVGNEVEITIALEAVRV